MSGNRVLITGGAGFIGSHLAKSCLERGDEVHVAVRAETALHRLKPCLADIVTHTLELGDEAAVARCLAEARPHQLFHLATETRPRTRTGMAATLAAARNDVWNLLTLIRAMVAMRHHPDVLIRTGSIAEYGPLPPPFREGQCEAPSTAYAAALVAGTRYLGMLRPSLPFAAITARLALVYGPGQSEAFLVPALIRNCLDGLATNVERPRDRRDLLFIDDAIEALQRLASDPPRDCNALNVATGVAPTMREAAMQVIEATGADPELVTFAAPIGDDPVSELRASADLAREAIGWSAQTSLAEGIAETVARFRENQRVAVWGGLS